MPFASPDDFLAFARERALLPSDQIDALTRDESLPRTIDDFLAALRDRGILAMDFADDRPVELTPTAPAPAVPPIEYIAIPHEESGEEFVPFPIHERSKTGPPQPPMKRETLWLWFALGGLLWLAGFVVLGFWLGGCFNQNAKPVP